MSSPSNGLYCLLHVCLSPGLTRRGRDSRRWCLHWKGIPATRSLIILLWWIDGVLVCFRSKAQCKPDWVVSIPKCTPCNKNLCKKYAQYAIYAHMHVLHILHMWQLYAPSSLVVIFCIYIIRLYDEHLSDPPGTGCIFSSKMQNMQWRCICNYDKMF